MPVEQAAQRALPAALGLITLFAAQFVAALVVLEVVEAVPYELGSKRRQECRHAGCLHVPGDT